MEKTPFIWLGSKRAEKRGVGNKGTLLDKATQFKLPVPNGGILLDEFYHLALEAGLLRVKQGETVVADDPEALSEALYDDLRFPRLTQPLAVRSAFSAEDRADESLAGFFESRLHVDPQSPQQLADALTAVYTSALRREGDFRRDVLVMEMVNAQTAGVAFSEAGFEDELINYTGGTADKLVSGHVEGETLLLPKIKLWEGVSPELPPFAQRLQKLLRGVRNTFGDEGWDIEWADDGETCWLVQLRPITRAPRRNEAFTYANIREIMPDPPSVFMADIVEECADGLFGYYRQFDPQLPTDRPLIELFDGRPFFNLTLLTDMMRKWGLPTRLVTGSIGGEANVEAGLRPVRFLAHTPTLLRQGWDQLTAVSTAQQTTATFLRETSQLGNSFSENVDSLRRLFTQLVTQMFSLTAALSGPLLILRLTDTLSEHNARQTSISTEMYSDLAPLRELVAQKPALVPTLEQGKRPDDADFLRLWQTYLEKHGQRGVYESDIARPRYREAPENLLRSLTQPARGQKESLPPLSFKARLTQPVWWQCSRVMQARERFRYDAMTGYARIRSKLLALAETAVASGQLPTPDHLWRLHSDEVRQLDAGVHYDDAFFAKREKEIAASKAYDYPDLIHRFDDAEQFLADGAAVGGGNGRLSGVSLTSGRVSGKAWVLREPSTVLPDGFAPDETILVARSIDAGWIPTFALVAGVVVEIGGDLSHGSIILREIGLPAITNVKQATRALQTGSWLQLEAGKGIVSQKIDAIIGSG